MKVGLESDTVCLICWKKNWQCDKPEMTGWEHWFSPPPPPQGILIYLTNGEWLALEASCSVENTFVLSGVWFNLLRWVISALTTQSQQTDPLANYCTCSRCHLGLMHKHFIRAGFAWPSRVESATAQPILASIKRTTGCMCCTSDGRECKHTGSFQGKKAIIGSRQPPYKYNTCSHEAALPFRRMKTCCFSVFQMVGLKIFMVILLGH